MRVSIIISMLFISTSSFAADSTKKVRYSKGKRVDFESLLIEGQIKRPDISIVTGNMGESMNGLLRLRENFIDEIAKDVGEDIP